MQALLSKSKALQLVQTVSLGCAVDDSVFQKDTASTDYVNCGLDGTAAAKVLQVLGILKLERGTALVEQQAGIVVALIEVFKDAGKDLRVSGRIGQSLLQTGQRECAVLIGQRYPLRGTLIELAFESSGEEGR